MGDADLEQVSRHAWDCNQRLFLTWHGQIRRARLQEMQQQQGQSGGQGGQGGEQEQKQQREGEHALKSFCCQTSCD